MGRMIIQSKNVWINEQFQPAQVEVSDQQRQPHFQKTWNIHLK